MYLCIGVDVGGTNTDAVLLKGHDLLCWSKVPTTQDITSGVVSVIRETLKKLPEYYHQTSANQHFGRVNIGTTHFVNAVVQRKEIARVAVLRLCGPASRSVPPFSDFPNDLKNKIYGGYHFLDGGYQYNGEDITTLDGNEVRRVVEEIQQNGIRHIAVVGVFSLVRNEQENEVARIINEVNPNMSVTLSHEVGLLGLLERENAAILNESLKPLAQRTVRAFHEALSLLGLKCPFYLTQNDGTIISARRAMCFPVFTFSSGPTNSMRGATFLCNVKDAIVIDIGGTTTDVGVVLDTGFPRQASTRVKVGGVNTNFRMPDVLSIGLGGGSYVRHNKNNTEVQIGPRSVGYNLTSDARIYGGNVLTVSDIAVAGGLCDFGDKEKVRKLNKDLVEKALREIRQMTEAALDQVKIKGEDQCVILVGGGSVVIDETQGLKGASKVIKPENCSVANAVGAALSQVSGTVDYVCSLDKTPREMAEERAELRAREKAIQAGAHPETVEIVDRHVTTLGYLPGDQIRLHFTAVGDLKEQHLDTELLEGVSGEIELEPQPEVPNEENTRTEKDEDSIIFKEPTVDPKTGDWLLSTFDVNCIAIGAGILGSGGGGSPYIGQLIALKQLRNGKEIRVIHPDRLGTSPQLTGLVSVVAFMGAPTIAVEKITSGTESLTALSAIKSLLAAGDSVVTKDTGSGVRIPVDVESLMATDLKLCKGTQIVALASCEIGGFNSMEPLSVAAELGMPVVDADGMGRAFPELQMFLPFIKGEPPYPFAFAEEKGTAEIAVYCDTAKNLENYMRLVCVKHGCASAVATALKPEVFQEKMVLFSLSRAWRLGYAVLKARRDKLDPIHTILSQENGRHLITGKISDLSRKTERGFAGGWVKIEGSGNCDGGTLFIDFQNENLLAYTTTNSSWNGDKDNILAVTPDLITVVDADTGEPITTELLRYGLRVAVLALPCSLLLRTTEALQIVGPAAFGYKDVEYRPLGSYKETVPIPRAQPQNI